MRTMENRLNPNTLVVAGIVIGGGVLALKLVGNVKDIFSGSSSSDQAVKSIQSNSAWDPNYWQQFGNPPGNPPGKLLYWSQVVPVVEALYEDLGNFYIPWIFSTASPSKVVADVQNAKNKAQFSQFVWYFNKHYGEDLFSKMYRQLLGGASGTPNATLTAIVNYVNKLPN